MIDLANTAERLRIVKEAHQRFLGLWAVDCLIEQRKPMQKVAADVAVSHDGSILPDRSSQPFQPNFRPRF